MAQSCCRRLGDWCSLSRWEAFSPRALHAKQRNTLMLLRMESRKDRGKAHLFQKEIYMYIFKRRTKRCIMYYVSVYREKFISSYYGSVASLHYAPNMFTWCPHAKPVANRPNTRNGCAAAWYFTSFLIGSGKKNLNCAKICGAIKQNNTFE